jgi:hypothetical protein
MAGGVSNELGKTLRREKISCPQNITKKIGEGLTPSPMILNVCEL